MTVVQLIYAEYENGEPPFGWFDGAVLKAEQHSLIHRKLASIGEKRSKRTTGQYGSAARVGETMQLTTSSGIRLPDRSRQSVVLVLSHLGGQPEWDSTAEHVAGVLEAARMDVDRARLRAALEGSWADLALRFPRRLIRAACARIAGWFGRGREANRSKDEAGSGG